MRLYHSLKGTKNISRASVVAVGVFDGVHRGHARIILDLVNWAKEIRGKSVVLTFYPHPAFIVHKACPPLLISLKHRVNLIGAMGVDIVAVVNFNRAFAGINPEVFIKNVLIKKFSMKGMLAGSDFTFGKKGEGDINSLKVFSEKYNFSFKEIRPVKKRGKIISSTYIRSLILNGKLKDASGLLGRPVSILGTVKSGTGTGRILGYPTANIDPHHEARPPKGVYAVYTVVGKKRYKGVLNIGFRPTFSGRARFAEPTIEAHLFNFRKNIYGKDIEIFFVKKLRNEKKFTDKDALIQAIRDDEKRAAKIFRKNPG